MTGEDHLHITEGAIQDESLVVHRTYVPASEKTLSVQTKHFLFER